MPYIFGVNSVWHVHDSEHEETLHESRNLQRPARYQSGQ